MTNDAVRGYVILTLKSLEYKKEEIENILSELHMQFDTMTEFEAEQYYYCGDWKNEKNNK